MTVRQSGLDQGTPAWVVWAAGVMIAAGAAATVWVIHESLYGIGSHMPPEAITVFAPPRTPGGNSLNLYESHRIFFVHVPSAMAAMTVSALMALGAVLALISRRQHWENLVAASAQVGIVACFITMATGYFWGDFAWIGNVGGWNFKDPRLNATLVLWLSYVALVVLRAGIDDPGRRRTFTAVYGLVTVPLYPLVSRAIEIFGKEVHPIDLKDLMGSGEIAGLLSYAKPAVVVFFVGFILLRYAQLRTADSVRSLRAMAATE